MGKKPAWIRTRALGNEDYQKLRNFLDNYSFHIVCKEASCPNIRECFLQGTSTFLILGRICTRECTFCGIQKGEPLPIDPQESDDIALAVQKLKLKYVVITSVTRDDLPCGGARHFVRTIRSIRESSPEALIEVLLPDFKGNAASLESIVALKPAVINHNLETVPRLYPEIRPGAYYERSLDLLSTVKIHNPTMLTKSGIMLGLGETIKEVIDVMHDLRSAHCDIITISQYLQPSVRQVEVKRYIPPELFSYLENIAIHFGFHAVVSGPLIRSSYKAHNLYAKAKCRR